MEICPLFLATIIRGLPPFFIYQLFQRIPILPGGETYDIAVTEGLITVNWSILWIWSQEVSVRKQAMVMFLNNCSNSSMGLKVLEKYSVQAPKRTSRRWHPNQLKGRGSCVSFCEQKQFRLWKRQRRTVGCLNHCEYRLSLSGVALGTSCHISRNLVTDKQEECNI